MTNLVAKCPECGATTVIENGQAVCPKCGESYGKEESPTQEETSEAHDRAREEEDPDADIKEAGRRHGEVLKTYLAEDEAEDQAALDRFYEDDRASPKKG